MDRLDQVAAPGACARAGSAARLAPPPFASNDNDAAVAQMGIAARLGALEVRRPKPRRGYGFLKGRRTRFQQRRKTGRLTPEAPVHRDEREIVARN